MPAGAVALTSSGDRSTSFESDDVGCAGSRGSSTGVRGFPTQLRRRGSSYQAATVAEAEERILELREASGAKNPAIVRLWDNAWAEFVPFLGFGREIRRIVCTTNAIESVYAHRWKQALNAFDIRFDGRLTTNRRSTTTEFQRELDRPVGGCFRASVPYRSRASCRPCRLGR